MVLYSDLENVIFPSAPPKKHTVILIDLPNLNLHGLFLMPDYLSFWIVCKRIL